MMAPRNRDLLTYSFVSQGIYGATDRLAGILPFFLPIIKEMQGRLFVPDEFIQACNERYPWSINHDICQELVARFHRAGWLKQERHGTEISYFVLSIKDYGDDEQHLRDAANSLEEVGQAFHKFVGDISPLQTFAYTPEDLQELLLGWLVDKRAFERNAILAALETDQPTRRGRLPVAPTSQNATGARRDEDYLCARFIEDISVTNEPLFEKLVAISAIAFVVEVALDISRPTQEEMDFRTTELFLDGPLTMDLLELSGKERYDAASYIYDKLRAFRAQLYIFSHSCDEIRDNLRAVLNAHPGERYGPTAEALKKKSVVEDYARAVLNDVEGNVERIGLTVRQVSIQSYPSTHIHFTDDMVLDLKSRLPWEDLPAERDAKSVAFVMRGRSGKGSPALARNRSVLISNNVQLADAARRFCVERGLIKGNQIGPALHRRQLAAMLWLALGSDEKSEITRRELLQRCADVVRLSPHVVRKARSVLAGYDATKASQFEALISTPRASQMIMDLTLGMPDAISKKNIDEILDEIKRSAAEELNREHLQQVEALRKRRKEDLAKLRQTHSAEVEQLQGERNDLRSDVERSRERLADMAARLERLEGHKVAQEQDICLQLLEAVQKRERALRTWVRTGASVAIVTAGLASAYVALGLDLSYPMLVLMAAGVVAAALITALQISDHWMVPFEQWIFRRKLELIERRLSEIGRLDLIGRFDVCHSTRNVRVCESKSDTPVLNGGGVEERGQVIDQGRML